MADHSFDIVSEVDMQEVSNAVNQAVKEVANRYDLKDANCVIEFNQKEGKIHVSAADDYKVKTVYDILLQKMIKRSVSPKSMSPGEVQSALGGEAKQDIGLRQGLEKDQIKKVIKDIKDLKTKVSTQQQGESIRVVGKKIDELQSVIGHLKQKEYDFALQYVNFR